jgi:hypothetical protein
MRLLVALGGQSTDLVVHDKFGDVMGMNALRVLPVTVGASLFCLLNSSALPLNIVPSEPDLYSSLVSVSYDAETDVFQASGWTTEYFGGSAAVESLSGQFNLTANITAAGVLTGGQLTIDGDIGSGNELLLSGLLVAGGEGSAFGAVAGGPGRFEFLFTVNGGNAVIQDDFASSYRGIIVNPFFSSGDAVFSGDWTSNFSNDGYSGAVDCAVLVPEPSSLLVALGAGVAVAVRRREGKRI